MGDARARVSIHRRAWRRAALWMLAVLAVLTVLFHAGGGWYFASTLDQRALAGEERRHSSEPEYVVDVLAVGDGTVTLDGRDDDRVARAGTYGLEWEGGRAVLGEVLREDNREVTRVLSRIAGSPLTPDVDAALDTRVYTGDPREALAMEFEDVTVPGELGDYPAWFIDGAGDAWFIFVHGNGMTRGDGLRVLPIAAEAGMPALVITYRNDEGAPEAPGKRLTYGKDEWRDVEAAVQYALDQGARSVVLHGVSMGGGVIMAFLLESELAPRVAGVILDAPVLDFERTVESQASGESLPLIGLPLPSTLIETAEWIAARRFDVDWDYLDYLERAGELETPILLIHGDEDPDVPLATSADLAALRPDLVRNFYIVEGAGHVEAWNADPAEYRTRLLAFLDSVRPIE